MKKTLSILSLSLLSGLALAANTHHGQHGHHGHQPQGHLSHGHHGHHGHAASHHGHDHHHHEMTGFGQPGKAEEVSRTIEVDMTDNMRFTPDNIVVDSGETIRFMVKNSGQLEHELILGDMDELLAHAEMMRDMPDMDHDDPNMISLEPGEEGELIWKFDEAGTVDFACLIPGHMEAGMKG